MPRLPRATDWNHQPPNPPNAKQASEHPHRPATAGRRPANSDEKQDSMQQPQDDDSGHPLAGYRPSNVVIDMTWLDKFLREAVQRNGKALAEMQQDGEAQASARTADPQLEDREAEP